MAFPAYKKYQIGARVGVFNSIIIALGKDRTIADASGISYDIGNTFTELQSKLKSSVITPTKVANAFNHSTTRAWCVSIISQLPGNTNNEFSKDGFTGTTVAPLRACYDSVGTTNNNSASGSVAAVGTCHTTNAVCQ